MSSIIQPVSFTEEDAKTLIQKLGEHLGIHRLAFCLGDGITLEGIVSEIGKDYLAILDQDSNTEILVPIERIAYVRYPV